MAAVIGSQRKKPGRQKVACIATVYVCSGLCYGEPWKPAHLYPHRSRPSNWLPGRQGSAFVLTLDITSLRLALSLIWTRMPGRRSRRMCRLQHVACYVHCCLWGIAEDETNGGPFMQPATYTIASRARPPRSRETYIVPDYSAFIIMAACHPGGEINSVSSPLPAYLLPQEPYFSAIRSVLASPAGAHAA